MILYGASGHGKVVKSAADGMVNAFFDDNPSLSLFDGLPVQRYSHDQQEELVVIAIGDNNIRKKVSQEISHAFGTVIAFSSEIDESVAIGEGCQILHQSLIQPGSKLGNHVIVNSQASVDHDCQLGDFVHIAPNTTLCGNVKVGEGSIIGAGSVVLPNITIGKWCVIGAGSVVINDIPDNTKVAGNPARQI